LFNFVNNPKIFLLNIYWRLCQYPLHFIFNITSGFLLYLCSIIWGSTIQSFVIGRIIYFHNFTTVGFYFSSSLNLAIKILISYLIFSILLILLVTPFLFRKGIIFYVIGYTFYYWFLFFPIHLILNIGTARLPLAHNLPTVGVSILLIIIFVVALFFFPNHIIERKISLRSNKLKKKVRIVHLSDIQAENCGIRETRLPVFVNRLNPDIILISGDLFNFPYEYNRKGFNCVLKILDQFKPKTGIFIVPGHHDNSVEGSQHLVNILQGHIKLLNDEWCEVFTGDDTILLFGAKLSSRMTELKSQATSHHYGIYLAHDPALSKNLNREVYDLALYGHTHAGQVYIPIISNLFVGKYRHGLYCHNGIPIYVNAGIGMEGYLAPRIRWFTFPEIVVIDIEPQNANSVSNHTNSVKVLES